MNSSSDKCIVLLHCYVWDRTIRVRESGQNSISSLAPFQLVMGDMLYEQVMKPRDAPSASSTNSFRTTFMENLSIIMKHSDREESDEQSISLSNADVNFYADMQKCDELSVQQILGATINCHRSTEVAEKHSAAAITMETEQAEDGDNYPMFDSGYSTVLTNSMLNCRKVEEHAISIMRAESGVQMASTHKCRKTYYVKSRDGNIHAIESDALIVPSLKQDLIEGRADTNGLNSHGTLDTNTNICEIYPRVNSKLYGDEQSIPFISDALLGRLVLRRTPKQSLHTVNLTN